MAVYVPALRRLFYTVPLGIQDWIIVIGMGLMTLLIIDARKMFLRSLWTGKKQAVDTESVSLVTT
jgi:hypothetical protein